MEDSRFTENNKLRCYYCKTHLFKKAWEIAKQRGFEHVLEGSNLDDMNDFRPGLKACKQMGVISPLLEIGFTKMEIRRLSETFCLPTFNKPSLACLSSRIPYGVAIDEHTLNIIERSEDYLRDLGIYQVRVRYYKNIARIEILPEDFHKVMTNRTAIVEGLKNMGFLYVCLDLEGYKSGSMNL